MTLFKPFLLTKCLEKSKNLQFFKKIVLKNSETRFQKGETRFQNAETRFQNAKTALSRIFFARTGMDSAQKKPACKLKLIDPNRKQRTPFSHGADACCCVYNFKNYANY